MKLSLEGKGDPRTPDALISEGHVVFAAAAAHLWRATGLTLSFSEDNMRAGDLSVLFSDVPCAMPRLRNLQIDASGLAATDIPHLNITGPPLRLLHLVRTVPLSWDGLLGSATTILHLRGLSLRFSVLRRVLELSPNLHELNFYFCGIVDDRVGSQLGPPLATRLSVFHVFGMQQPELLLLQSLSIPVTPIQEVVLNTVFMDVPFDLAYDFLRIEDLVDIRYMNLSADQLAIATTGGHERIVDYDSLDLNVLDDLFSTGAISTTLRELAVSLENFMDLIMLIARHVRDAPSLPRLEKLTLWVSQSSFERDNDVMHNGPPVLAPSLSLVELFLHGREVPTVDLVRHFIACMACISAPSLTDAGFTIADYHGEGDSYLHRFDELFREETQPFRLVEVPHPQ